MVQFIIYVSDQQRSRDFYRKALQLEPSLDVPGMTEFAFSENCKLGIMPENGIAKILGENTRHPSEGNGIPRCEIYYYVNDVDEFFNNAVAKGAKAVSNVQERNWGDIAGYVSDPDGHILVFAQEKN